MNSNSNINFITNKPHRSFFHELRESFSNCNRFFMSVAFIHMSGLQIFMDEFKDAESNKVEGKVITTNYMLGTEPNALEALLKLKNIQTRVYDTTVKSNGGFHTKGYIFDMGDYYKVIIGSSNLTHSALKTNQEWNLSILLKNEPLHEQIINEFNHLWDKSECLDQSYLDSYRSIYYQNHDSEQSKMYEQIISFLQQSEGYQFLRDIASFIDIDEEILKQNLAIEFSKDIKPNSMQEQAMERLKELRDQNEKRALIISATGTGKTYLAAFDALQFQPKRLLFVVHRAKILKDAEKTFKNIMPKIKSGILTGTSKVYNVDYLFATNTMMSKDEVLNGYASDYFDYIVIDEAHRSAAPTYRKIIDYFKPKFLLGMTATPERTDALSIFKLYDRNIAIEIRLRGALEKSLVVPFHYFGIEDAVTDYKDIQISEIDKLAERLNIKVRVDLIIENIEKFSFSGKKRRALGFCVNKKHAEYMASEFNKLNYPSICLTGDSSDDEREYAIYRLENEVDNLSFIFTVDIFNEGIDIPSVNLILMLRPTESPIIFTQQLGRGLRHNPYKDFLTVLDFIGNHNKSFLIPIALAGDNSYDKDDLIEATKNDFFDIPGDTFIRLEEQSKQRILEQLESVNFNQIKFLKEAYFNVKNTVMQLTNKISYPSLMHYDMGGFDPVRFINSKGSYIKFVEYVEDDIELTKFTNNTELYKYIKFVDDMIPIKKPEIFVILSLLLDNNSISIEDIIKEVSKYTRYSSTDYIEYVVNLLNHDYYDSIDSYKYGKFIFINGDKTIERSKQFDINLKDNLFETVLRDSIDYGLFRYLHEFPLVEDAERNFQLYHPYNMREVAMIMKYDKKLSAFRGQGVLRIDKDYFLFVDLLKHEVKESIDYKDTFIDKKYFQWESQNKTTQSSIPGQNFINHIELGYSLHLFVRKNKVEDGVIQGYTYFGKVITKDYTGNKPIRFRFELEDEVPESIYYRFETKKEEQ